MHDAFAQADLLRLLVQEMADGDWRLGLVHHVLRFLASAPPDQRCLGADELRALAAVQTMSEYERSVPKRQLVTWNVLAAVQALVDPEQLRPEDVFEYGDDASGP